MSPELHRPIAIDRIGAAGLTIDVVAKPEECQALGERMLIPAVLALRCRFVIRPAPAGSYEASGHLMARVVQTCVVSLEDFESDVEERFSVRFVPSGTESDDIDPESEDELPFIDGMIDLGEAAAEQLALSLDPYPRSPGAELPQEEADAEIHPFAALAALRRTN
jgi:uncharacterized metal-binding protein YceD (DUF177 family)